MQTYTGSVGKMACNTSARGDSTATFEITNPQTFRGAMADLIQCSTIATTLVAPPVPGTPERLKFIPVDTMGIVRAIGSQLSTGRRFDIVAFTRSMLAMHCNSGEFRIMLNEALEIVIRQLLHINAPQAHRDLLSVLHRI